MNVPSDKSGGFLIATRQVWTNSSVLALCRDADPVQVITEKARALTMEAIQDGWSGPPYDPFLLAEYLKVAVVARQDISDARTVPSSSGYVIEFNPNRPRSRVKYSICHELAHTLFPDCPERIRNRISHRDAKGDEWQLETLCNIGAAELLMPIGSIATFEREHLTVDSLLEARKQHEVSAEAIFLRAVRLTAEQCCVFSSSRRVVHKEKERYLIDYAVPSRVWAAGGISAGMLLPEVTVATECTAIGFTAKGHETWDTVGSVRIECLGVGPYPNQTYPRVLGIIRPQRQTPVDIAQITYLRGDATRPRGTGPRIIAQVVNDSAFTWGGGFSLALREIWPVAQRAFRAWAEQERRNLRLGNSHVAQVDEGLAVVSMIAQRGFGPSPKPRIRYVALKACLDALGQVAAERGATVHMPKIGSGQAGGSWNIVRELVEESVCGRGVKVVVYELPGGPGPSHPQAALEFPS
jgi:Zn-dependent peptidase ImmA (M78 family)/O-acetyl-ADP-ribose deacetylase (regulator of RNase III)